MRNAKREHTETRIDKNALARTIDLPALPDTIHQEGPRRTVVLQAQVLRQVTGHIHHPKPGESNQCRFPLPSQTGLKPISAVAVPLIEGVPANRLEGNHGHDHNLENKDVEINIHPQADNRNLRLRMTRVSRTRGVRRRGIILDAKSAWTCPPALDTCVLYLLPMVVSGVSR